MERHSSSRLTAALSGTFQRQQQSISAVDDNWRNDEFSSPSKVNIETGSVNSSLLGLCGLHYFYASLFATILEDTITELRILGECNNELRIAKTQADMKMLLAKKYSISQPAVHDELDEIDPKKLGKEEYKLDKLASDRKFLYDTLLATYLDLTLYRSFQGLAEKISEVIEHNRHFAFLMEKEAKNRMLRRELTKQLRSQRNHFKSAAYDVDVIIANMKTQVEDAALNGEACSRYIASWEQARTEQHLQKILDKEAVPTTSIEVFKQKLDNEQRIHSEIDLLSNILINETIEKVETMMNKYDKDIEVIDLKIQIMKNNYQDQLSTRKGLEETYEKHDKQSKDWIQFKDDREKARQYRDKMTNAATVVQAWWRGLLVRLQIGPFKPAKRPGKAKDKKKK